MKKHQIIICLLICFGLTFIFSSCGREKRCENVICTKEFVVISLKLEYPDGQPVLLDSSKVFWVSENRFIEQKNDLSSVFGNYTIVDDGMQRELLDKKEIMHFTGYLNGKTVCERDVLVGANCCHVNYLGKESLTQIIQYE
jgi:hypothetical protein